jgi:hypothetical protein
LNPDYRNVVGLPIDHPVPEKTPSKVQGDEIHYLSAKNRLHKLNGYRYRIEDYAVTELDKIPLK